MEDAFEMTGLGFKFMALTQADNKRMIPTYQFWHEHGELLPMLLFANIRGGFTIPVTRPLSGAAHGKCW